MRALATLLLLLIAATTALSAPVKIDTCPVVIAPVIAQAPTVDGKLTDPAWEQAAKLGPFVQLTGGPAKNETVARVLRSGGTLFIGVKCGIPKDAKLKTDQTKRDSDVYMEECVEVFIDPGISLRKYLHFLVSAANVQRDESGDKLVATPFDVSWDGKWRSATSRDESAWYAELAIPLTDLGLREDAPALLGLNVCRDDNTLGDTTCWSPTFSGFHEPARFGVLSLPSAPIAQSVKLTLGDFPAPKIGRIEAPVTVDGAGAAALSGVAIAGNEESRTQWAFAVRKGASAAGFELKKPGLNAAVIAVADQTGNVVAASKRAFDIRETLVEQYGYRLPGGEKLGLWWAESTYKIHRDKPLPLARSEAVELSAAGNEFEAAQLVLRPAQDVDVTPAVSDFAGPGGKIPAAQFKLHEVAYVPVTIPTDRFGWADDWPDPLPEIAGALHCKAGENQPIWLLAHVPAATKPGVYTGEVTLKAGAASPTVPVRLRVWGFSLTPETHLRTAYGVNPDFGFLGVKDADQQRQVFDLYMQSCRDHRISPYDPMAFYPMDIKLQTPMRKLTCGRLAIEIDQGQAAPWRLFWDGKEIATQQTSLTQFERLGVGWRGTGESWPYVNAIQSITEVANTPKMRVLEIVGAHTVSVEAQRSFKLTFRLFIPAGDDWFGMKLMKMESTDPTEVEVRHYFNIPRTTFKAEQVANGKDYAAWSGGGIGFGMLCLGAPVGGLGIAAGGDSVTVSNTASPAFRIKQGQTHQAWGPLVVYFVTDKTSAADLAARAQDLSKRINLADPAGYAPTQPTQITEERREGISFTHDFTKFDQGAARYLDEFHFNGFNLAAMPDDIAGNPRFTDEFKRLHKEMYAPVIEHLRQKGWLKVAYSYWYDEPEEKDYPYVVQGMRTLGDNCPGLTRLLTEQPEPGLIGAIDLWVPVLSMYKQADCQTRQAAGEQVWWYVCCGPRAPYPNNFIDHPAINHRIRCWMAEKYGVTGELFWATTFYGNMPDEKAPRNPWRDGMTYTPGGGYWGNGDGMLLYPACRERSDKPMIAGPVSSIRWEMLRDGLEDDEYFWTLKQEMARLKVLRPQVDLQQRRAIDAALKAAKDALAAPDRLAESLTKFTKDPQDLLRARERLAQAIEQCRGIE